MLKFLCEIMRRKFLRFFLFLNQLKLIILKFIIFHIIEWESFSSPLVFEVLVPLQLKEMLKILTIKQILFCLRFPRDLPLSHPRRRKRWNHFYRKPLLTVFLAQARLRFLLVVEKDFLISNLPPSIQWKLNLNFPFLLFRSDLRFWSSLSPPRKLIPLLSERCWNITKNP